MTTSGQTYLHVCAETSGQPHWVVWEGADGTPAQPTAGGGWSYRELHERAQREGRELRVEEAAWQLMVDAGKAPTDVPDDVIIRNRVLD
jgi:hypothetical protein